MALKFEICGVEKIQIRVMSEIAIVNGLHPCDHMSSYVIYYIKK